MIDELDQSHKNLLLFASWVERIDDGCEMLLREKISGIVSHCPNGVLADIAKTIIQCRSKELEDEEASTFLATSSL